MRRFEWTVRCVIGLAVLICAVDVAGIAIGYVGRSPDPHSQPQTQTRTQPQARTPPPTEPQSRPGVLPQGRPSPAVTAFFSSYVDASGRVVRKDQGGDTVSEGQGYALLLAAAVGDRARFSSVWTWTKAHLQRQDGLLAWHWSHGAVADWMPAADGDLDTAWALSIAGRRFADLSLEAAAQRMAGSILREETASTAIGPVLVAGPWARTSPSLIEPGYFVPAAFTALGELTHDARWESAGR